MGQYSVKSAYALLQEMKGGNQLSSNSGFWKKLWNLKIPLKVKHFLWRASKDCLPTKDQLRIKRVNVDALCPTCNLEVETTTHAIISCPFAKEC